jgi:murein DD-endopeptidase MepM/ murein hydrolase activator NlpD
MEMKPRTLKLTIAISSIVIVIGLLAFITADEIAIYVRYRSLINKPPDAKIAVPIRGIRAQQIADTWGAARGADRKHEGQDIFAARNTPIYSATDGYILNIGENALGGRTVSVIGAGGRVFYYAHLQAYGDLREGDAVTTNSIIGYVGTSGNAAGTPPHLHFAVYTNSGAINPLTLF